CGVRELPSLYMQDQQANRCNRDETEDGCTAFANGAIFRVATGEPRIQSENAYPRVSTSGGDISEPSPRFWRAALGVPFSRRLSAKPIRSLTAIPPRSTTPNSLPSR